MASTQIEASEPYKHILPTTTTEAFKSAHLLRMEDRRELEGAGYHPMLGLPISVARTKDPIKFVDHHGELCGFAGVVEESPDVARIWMLCTPAVEKIPITFVRHAKEWLDALPYLMLHNVADPRNTIHMKLLHFLGFKRLMFVPVGPKRLTYVEFAKLCASH